MTMPALRQWRDSTVDAAYTVAEYLASDKSRDARAQALAELPREDLLLFARADNAPRGFAGGERAEYRRLENARKRAPRHVDRVRRDAQA